MGNRASADSQPYDTTPHYAQADKSNFHFHSFLTLL